MKIRTLTTMMMVATVTNMGVASAEALNYQAGDKRLAMWILPKVTMAENNQLTPARVELGRHLFFDPRLSGDGNMSCATCHNPALGWSDGLPTAKGVKSTVLGRASPTIVNSAFNTIQMWDGRKKDLPDQAMGPLKADMEMNTNFEVMFKRLNGSDGYKKMFEAAYPGEGISESTLARAIAAFESTVVMNDSPFDKWLAGDATAMSEQQVRGLEVFMNPQKGNCAVCHAAPNFTDNGFHNLGLATFGKEKPDMGRFEHKAVPRMKGAFKTPSLRGISQTAPYFHDGSAADLMAVVEHYVLGGVVKTNVSPNLHPLSLSQQEKEDLVAFMRALTGTTPAVTVPVLPEM